MLEQWEEAWRGDTSSQVRLFTPALLKQPGVFVMGGFDQQGYIAGGGVAFASDGVVGVSNLFGHTEGLFAAATQIASVDVVVRYENGHALAAARADGFIEAGLLRIWSYAP